MTNSEHGKSAPEDDAHAPPRGQPDPASRGIIFGVAAGAVVWIVILALLWLAFAAQPGGW